MGNCALLHGVSLKSFTQGASRFDGRFHLLLPRPRLLLKSWDQARPGVSGRSGEISTATTAPQNPEATGGSPQSVCSDCAFPGFTSRCHSCAVPADVEVESPAGSLVLGTLSQAGLEDRADGSRSASPRYGRGLQADLP